MLLEFKTKNYKCFKDEAVFSMMPAPKQKGLDYSLLTQAAGKRIIRLFVLLLYMVQMLRENLTL